jgi:4-alpha-glucanotransferase
VLLHPTSLPGRFGIGSFGPEARVFLDFLVQAGQRIWQVCPLGPTGYGDSPYQCFSAFAGNPMLIALEPLQEDGLLTSDELADPPPPGDRVPYGPLIPWKMARLYTSYERFRKKASPSARGRCERFAHLNREWLVDFARFMALKESHGGRSWTEWEEGFRDRHPEAMAEFATSHADRIDFHTYLQWLFHSQWYSLRSLANAHGVRILGDLPIFAAHDSADVWARRELFELDGAGQPTVMAGVPPDYFSATGQLWGNPIYRWEEHRARDFDWWESVIRNKFRLYDYVRIDHFRGFAAYWAVPQGETTAQNGSWVEAPGEELFMTLESHLGRMPLIAEDLGVITRDVVELIHTFGFARMKVLQFAFDSGEENDYLPHTYEANSVVYTGTHDNNTMTGWLKDADPADREAALTYVNSTGDQPHWDFIRTAIASTAHFAVVPAQDLLGLGSEARMNVPGTTGGNWTWRLGPGQLTSDIAARLGALTATYGRA